MDEKWMRRCLELAKKAHSEVKSNPKVGCVIVHEGEIIGEGYHQKFGEAHAEVNAINSVEDKELLKRSTLYVSLEPCSHTGKTPPCSELIIKHQIPQVVIGAVDPNPKVNGRGIKMLEDAGIKVDLCQMDGELEQLNPFFNHFQLREKPYITLKWAESSDGFIYNANVARQLSNDASNLKVHEMRAEHQSILIGKTTLLNDNPLLSTRLVDGPSPTPVIVCRELSKEMLSSNLLSGQSAVLVFYQTTLENTDLDPTTNNSFIQYDEGKFFDELEKKLLELGIISLLVEGGQEILEFFIKNDQWNEIHQIKCNVVLGSGVPSPDLSPVIAHSDFDIDSSYADGDQWTSIRKTL